jgi:hypothetical protein
LDLSDKHRSKFKTFAYVGLVALIVVAAAYVAYFATQPCVHPGCGGIPDPLSVEASTINSPTSFTLQIFHGGTQGLSLSSYYVKDAAGHLYSSPGWMGPTLPPMSHVNVTFTVDGRDFTFQTKNTYAVGVHTSQNYLIDFTVAV